MDMKRLLATVLALAAIPALATDVTLNWSVPTVHKDGTTIAPGEIKWVNIYCGPATGQSAPYTVLATLPTQPDGTVPTSYTFSADVPYQCAVTFVSMQDGQSKESVATFYDGVNNVPDIDVASVVTSVTSSKALQCTSTTTCTLNPPVTLPRGANKVTVKP